MTAQPASQAALLSEQLARFETDPNLLEPDWRRFFGDLDDEARSLIQAIGQRTRATGANGARAIALAASSGDVGRATAIRNATLDSIRALMLIRSYRVRGHLEAKLDPLGLAERKAHPELDPRSYGFEEADLDRPIFINKVLGLETATMREILGAVRATYCGHIGVEFMHIQEPDQKAWIQERIEAIHNRTQFTTVGKTAILERLTVAEVFEQFLNKKYTGTKRFGLDGGEAMIPALEQILKRGGMLGLK
jgi:2-oxoglutarate dehydrogenase E1 component